MIEKRSKNRAVVFFGCDTHNCLQFGCQILEFAALCILQDLVILYINQLHMPTEDLCGWAELLANGTLGSSFFNLEERWQKRVQCLIKKNESQDCLNRH